MAQNFIIYWLPFVTCNIVDAEVGLLLNALCTAMWVLGGDVVTEAQVDLAEKMLLFYYKQAPTYFGACVHVYDCMLAVCLYSMLRMQQSARRNFIVLTCKYM